MNTQPQIIIPTDAPGLSGRNGGGKSANPMKKPEPKAVRRMSNRLAARRLAHSESVNAGRTKGIRAGGLKAPGSQKKG